VRRWRAEHFAREKGLLLNWVTAHDAPLHRDDLALGREQLDAKRKRWLTRHDQQTSGILGLLPLVKGLPVRLTAAVSKALKLGKHRRGVVVGWTLHPDEASAISGCARVLTHMSDDVPLANAKSNHSAGEHRSACPTRIQF